MRNEEAMIRCSHIKKIYNKDKPNQLEALSDVTFSMDQGELVAIMGKSGCGKSTFLHILGCLDTFDDGEYFLDGKKLKTAKDQEMARIRNEQIGIVLQDSSVLTVVDKWDEVCREGTNIEQLYKEEKINSKNVILLSDLVKLQNNKLQNKTIFFNPMGMAIFDIAIASVVYNNKILKEHKNG